VSNSYLDSLLLSNFIRESVMKSAIRKLDLPSASKGLDAGCGAGLQCLQLAREIGPEGHVTGLDISPEFLAHGKQLAKNSELAERISFKEGSIASIPFDDDSFDWVWSADCVGYGPWEPVPLLKELKRVTKPGGTIAIIAWSSEQLLPGYPLLEARLRTTTQGLAPFVKGMEPSRHFLRALGWLRKLGIEKPRAEVFVGSVHAPLTEQIHKAMKDLFDMRWKGVEKELAENELAEYHRLCLPESPDFIINHPDYYAFFSYSMFFGTV
jgi:demethylmenaquinone methyltransferase / 2-methoxy-6-polyprenyl-1,4-benzoquinol methylase